MTHDNPDNRTDGAVAAGGDRSLVADASSAPVMLGGQIDISVLPLEQQQALVREYTHDRMDLEKRAAELNMDIGALDQQLRSLTAAAAEAHANDVAVTVSHKTESRAGSTEVVIGNTAEAARGKMPKSQTNEFNWSPVVILVTRPGRDRRNCRGGWRRDPVVRSRRVNARVQEDGTSDRAVGCGFDCRGVARGRFPRRSA